MKKKILFIIITSLVILAGCKHSVNPGDSTLLSIKNSGQITAAQGVSHDWGDINIKGGNVSHDFVLKNTGPDDLILKGATTSCMCTTAKIELPDGSVSPQFGMHNNPTSWAYAIKSGEEFTMDVTFDPMAHGPNATGAIQRSVYLVTSAPADGQIAISNPRETRGNVTEIRAKGMVLSEDMYKDKYDEASQEEEVLAETDEKDHHDESEYADMPEYEIRGKHVLEKVMSKEDFVLIDVRETSELEETGVIKGARHIALGSLSLDTLTNAGVSKDDEIVLYCRSGNRSRQAYELLNTLGFTNVKSMRGGTVHWLEDNRPLVSWERETMDTNTSSTPEAEGGARASFDRESEDLGIVSATETTQTTFTLTNTGNENLIVGNISTSCACTSAELESKTIAPNTSTVLTVVFDPTVHEEPVEKFKRTVFLETNDPTTPEAEVSIWADIEEDTVQ